MSKVKGSIPAIITNDELLYGGELRLYFQVIFNEAQNLRLPYHNFRHMMHVLWLCHEALRFYAREGIITKAAARELLIAAMFHDFDHTGIGTPDRVNINRAIAGVSTHILEYDLGHLPAIIRLIRATEYPYMLPSSECELRAQILRDADMSQSFSTAWIQQVVFGLSQEWGKTPLEVLKLQPLFHEKLEFSTEWARSTNTMENIKQKIAEAEELIKLLS